MKLKMHENSLFAVLLRSRWWISVVVGLALAAGLRFLIPTLYAVFAGLPFFVIGLIAAWRQLRVPSGERVDATLEAARAMAWRDFAEALEEGFRRQGYTVKRIEDGAADLEVTKAHRRSIVCAKRWKVARTGAEPLRELHEARQARDAQEGIYVVAGEITDNARAFATQKTIKVLAGADLVKFLPTVRGSTKAKPAA
jgi:restriction system protein